jgi:hypothetical protein
LLRTCHLRGATRPRSLEAFSFPVHPGYGIAYSIFKQQDNCRAVIASEAKQSILPLRGEMDCFASLAMTARRNSKHAFATSPRNAPEALLDLPPNRGRGECRMPIAPAASCALFGTPVSETPYPAVMHDFRSAEIQTGETSILVHAGGEGPPLLLLHGFPQTHLMWRGVAPLLAREFTVVCADLRGYGQSGCPASTPDHAAYAKRTMARDFP